MSNTEQISEELSLEIRTLEKRLKLINKALNRIDGFEKLVFNDDFNIVKASDG